MTVLLPFGCILINKKCIGKVNIQELELLEFVIWRGMNDAKLVSVSPQFQLGYSRKNPNRGVEDILFWKRRLEFLDLLLYPWKFMTKGSFTPGNTTRLCYNHRNFQGQKPRPMEIPHDFFLITPRNSTSF